MWRGRLACHAGWWRFRAGRDGDAVPGGVTAQVIQGVQADAGGRGGGRVLAGGQGGEQGGGEAGGVADGGLVGAEEGADDAAGQAEAGAQPGGDDVAGQVDLAVPSAGPAGAGGRAAAAGVAALLAVAAEREFQGGGEGVEGGGVQAGQRGVVQGGRVAQAGRGGLRGLRRLWRRRGDGREGVVPLCGRTAYVRPVKYPDRSGWSRTCLV